MTRPKSGAVLFARDLPQMARFYEALLSMQVIERQHGYIVLESDDVQLVVHSMPAGAARSAQAASAASSASDAPSSGPRRRIDVPVKLFFAVDSLAATREAAVALGGALSPASREWEARGFRACDGHDPEGNIVQFRESAE